MAVTRLGAGAGGSTTGAALTFNGPSLAASDANTVIVVPVGISCTVSSALNILNAGVTATCGGVQMQLLMPGAQKVTQFGAAATSSNLTAFFYLFNPGTGVKSITVSPAAGSGVTYTQVRANAIGFSGVDPDGVSEPQTALTTTHSVSSVANGYSVRLLTNGAALTSPNQTNEYLAGASVGGVGDYVAIQSAVGTGSNISFTCAGTATSPNSVGVVLNPVAAAATTPTFRRRGAEATGVTASPLRVPAPRDIHSGDIILIETWQANSTATLTAPTGFTEAASSPMLSAGFTQRLFWKRATATEPAATGTYDFTYTGTVSVKGRAYRFSECVTSGDPFDFTTSAVKLASGTPTPAVSGTTTGADRLWVWLGAVQGSQDTFSILTGFTDATVPSGSLATNHSLQVKAQPAAAASGSLTATWTGGGAVNGSAAWLGALLPQPAAADANSGAFFPFFS